MENKIKIFENKEFGRVRTVIIDGEPWFVGKDVAVILGYSKPRNAIAMHVDCDDKKVAPIQGDLGGTQQMTIINESGIGMMYFKGLGTLVDNYKATEYFEKSAELGNQYAKRLLALEYISGKNYEQNIDKGISLLTECADSGDAFSCYKLGNLYLKGEIVNQDLDKAEKYLLSAENNEFTQYTLGTLYLQKEKYDIMKAISYFEKSAEKNMWSSYQLGRLYFFGADGLEKNNEKAIEFLNLSAEQGNEYAQNILDNQDKYENEMLASTIFSLFINLSRCIEDDYHNKFQSGRKMIDSKLRRMIQEKNQALGIKHEHGQIQEY